MQTELYTVFGLAFFCWVGLAMYASLHSDRLRRTKGFENCWTYRDFVKHVDEQPTSGNMEVLKALKSMRLKVGLIWLATMLGAVLALIAFGLKG